MSQQKLDGDFLMKLHDDTGWQTKGICDGLDVNLFFEDYEEDKTLAMSMDKICLNCPVIAECFEYGVNTLSWGVWGGVYLVDGKPDSMRNAHKTSETWNNIIEKVGL